MVSPGAVTPVASCESLFGRREFLPYFQAQSMDVAIVDVPWNGILESMKMENELKAPIDGVVARVNVSAGDSVEKGQVLVFIHDPASDEEPAE